MFCDRNQGNSNHKEAEGVAKHGKEVKAAVVKQHNSAATVVEDVHGIMDDLPEEESKREESCHEDCS